MCDNFYQMHICTEDPCPMQMKQYAEMLHNGFNTNYTDDSAPLHSKRHFKWYYYVPILGSIILWIKSKIRPN